MVVVSLWSRSCGHRHLPCVRETPVISSAASASPRPHCPIFAATSAGKAWGSHPLRKVGTCPVALS